MYETPGLQLGPSPRALKGLRSGEDFDLTWMLQFGITAFAAVHELRTRSI